MPFLPATRRDRRTRPVRRRARRTPPGSRRARGVRVALWTVVALCVGSYAASLLVPLYFQVQEQRLLIVVSGSMSPYIDAGDAVVMKQIENPAELRVGQVVSFWPQDSEVLQTHRIIRLEMLPVLEQDESTGRMVPKLDEATGEPITRPYIFTKGDANDEPDPNATPVNRVRGVVLAVHPGWGAVLGWAHSATGRFVMLGPPLLILAGMEVAAVVQARRARARRPALGIERSQVDDLLFE